MEPEVFEKVEGSDGAIHAKGDIISLSMDCGGSVFFRNGVTPAKGRHVRWLVGELNGVRVYISGAAVIMTTKDLNP